MLSFLNDRSRRGTSIRRREWLRVGGLGVLGLSLKDLLVQRSALAGPMPDNKLTDGLAGVMFGQAKNVIFLWLQGGPPQHETFDPKPDAPIEIRGPFNPIQTNVPGIQFCELLPRTAMRADKLAVIRSLATDDNNHDVSGYWVLTGYPYGPGSARQIKPDDWPYMGSVIKMLKPSERLPALTSVWLPDMMRLNDNVTPAGQTAGFLGAKWDPERMIGNPANPDYQIEGLSLPIDLPQRRMQDRAALLGKLNTLSKDVDRQKAGGLWDSLSGFALDLVTSGTARQAFDLSLENDALRDRYGRHTWGQSCLLARRLIEAGVRLVHVNWPREPGDSAVDNPLWDTHAQNADRLQDVLCPIFDVSFAALLDDLEDRGLLSETLVVAVGEFGRTPAINAQGGRDHWGSVFNCVLAGAGVAGGQVFGASDRNGAYPIDDPIRPHDLTATVYHLLGIPHHGVFHDRTGRPQSLTKGEPLTRLLGDRPATMARCESTGDKNLVPPFDVSFLVDTDFRASLLQPAALMSRKKGWRAAPLAEQSATGLQVTASLIPKPHVWLGAFHPGGDAIVSVPSGTKLILAQEIRSARGGHYTFSARISGGGSTESVFDQWFADVVTCRLALMRYANLQKNPLDAAELASQRFQPVWSDFEHPQEFAVDRFLGSTSPGANFSIGNGLCVAIILETARSMTLSPTESALLQIQNVTLSFSPRQRDDNVTV